MSARKSSRREAAGGKSSVTSAPQPNVPSSKTGGASSTRSQGKPASVSSSN